MSDAAAIGIAVHGLLLAWLAPIAFLDDGALAPDWRETLIPFGALASPLVIAVIGRSVKSLTAAALVGLVLTVVFFLGPGILLMVPTFCYMLAAATGRPTDA